MKIIYKKIHYTNICLFCFRRNLLGSCYIDIYTYCVYAPERSVYIQSKQTQLAVLFRTANDERIQKKRSHFSVFMNFSAIFLASNSGDKSVHVFLLF